MVELQEHPVFLGIGLVAPCVIMKGYQIANDQEMFNAAKRVPTKNIKYPKNQQQHKRKQLTKYWYF